MDKMAAILADDIFLNEHDKIAIQMSLKHVPGIQLTINQHCFR